MSALIEFDEVCKYYQMGDTLVKAADLIINTAVVRVFSLLNG